MTVKLKSIKYHVIVFSLAVVWALTLSTSVKAASFSDSQLKSFATALTVINQIALEWQPKVEAAPSQDQAAAMRQQADNEMRQAIENTDGIGIDDYQDIMEAAQKDTELRTRIETMLKGMTPN